MANDNRASGGAVPSANDAPPANSTAARAPRWSIPMAWIDPSAGWMHGRASQWLPVRSQGTEGSGVADTRW